ncbi:MAG TPA: 1,2-phenylacetyl-CoA epoxidase subunit PaaC [Anaerolineae bacterium]|nr:1,2-phenylacetyl-CoA epoxidase subunit PaaC [Anaerolineae bacterium]
MDHTALIALLTSLADDELILGHRNSEWTGHAPIIEEDIAFSNIAQDEMGHALLWYTILNEQLGQPLPDRMAFFRSADQFRNAQFVELPKGDWAITIVRQYLFDVYEQVRNAELIHSDFQPIIDVVSKIKREEVYHLMHSKGWLLRLGDATEESHTRMQTALDQLWPHALGLFEPIEEAPEYSAKLNDLRQSWLDIVTPILTQATLIIPANVDPIFGGRKHQHTPHLIDLLKDMQKVARMESPETVW